MKKLRWLKEWKQRKIGDISNASEKSAENFVSQGYAEYVIEEPKVIVPKITKTREIKSKPIDKVPDWHTASEKVKELYGKSWPEIMKGIDEIVKKYGVTKAYCNVLLNDLKRVNSQKNTNVKIVDIKKEEKIIKESEKDRKKRILTTDYNKTPEQLKEEGKTEEEISKYVEEAMLKINLGKSWQEEMDKSNVEFILFIEKELKRISKLDQLLHSSELDKLAEEYIVDKTALKNKLKDYIPKPLPEVKKSNQQQVKEIFEKEEEVMPQIGVSELQAGKDVIHYMYNEIISLLKEYLVMDEKQYKIIALWIIGTYGHEYFNTFPLLFFNAMRGSGKTRTLRLISALGNGGDGSVQNNLTEAVLFRIPRGKTTCIDEVEQIGNKEKATLRELLNAAYKKGMKVCRMKKTKKKNEEGQMEELQVAEEFEPYFPIALANINGLDEVLSDRAITLILEKSDDPEKTKKVEDFEKNLKIQWIKQSLCRFGVVVQVLQSKKYYEKWNFWLKSKHTYTTNTTNTTNTIYTTYTTNNTIKEYEKVINGAKITIDEDMEKFFEKLDSAGIVGRNFELFSPLLILAKFIDDMLFDDIYDIVMKMVDEKKSVEYTESKDVLLFEYVLNQELIINGDYIPIKQFTKGFRNFMDEEDNEDKWLNEMWMSKALKRLNLITDKRRMRQGMEVRLNYLKAREKLKIFKTL